MRVVNEPENEGQFIEFLTVPRRYRAGRWQATAAIGWSPRNWCIGVDVDFINPNARVFIMSFGPVWLAVQCDR